MHQLDDQGAHGGVQRWCDGHPEFAIAIPVALVAPVVAFGIYVAVVLIWVIPDRRIEKTLRT